MCFSSALLLSALRILVASTDRITFQVYALHFQIVFDCHLVTGEMLRCQTNTHTLPTLPNSISILPAMTSQGILHQFYTPPSTHTLPCPALACSNVNHLYTYTHTPVGHVLLTSRFVVFQQSQPVCQAYEIHTEDMSQSTHTHTSKKVTFIDWVWFEIFEIHHKSIKIRCCCINCTIQLRGLQNVGDVRFANKQQFVLFLG